MKKLFQICGIVLLLCGIGLYFMAGSGQEKTKGNQVYMGYMKDDKFIQTNSGTIGSDPEGYERMENLKVMGIFSGIGGAVVLLLSFAIKGE